ncbi:MAG: hypothetical protein ACYDER_09030 [Ktedonobacteraceae bacterium]
MPFSPSAKEGTNDQSGYNIFPPPDAKEAIRPNSPSKKVLNIVIATIIFCIGNFVTSFGLIGGLIALINDSLAVSLGLGLFLTSFIIFAIVIVQHNAFLLRWWLKILLPFAATGILFISFIAVTILFKGNNTLSTTLYGVSVLYLGIIIEVIALC